jgi:hypothetical protein
MAHTSTSPTESERARYGVPVAEVSVPEELGIGGGAGGGLVELGTRSGSSGRDDEQASTEIVASKAILQ